MNLSNETIKKRRRTGYILVFLVIAVTVLIVCGDLYLHRHWSRLIVSWLASILSVVAASLAINSYERLILWKDGKFDGKAIAIAVAILTGIYATLAILSIQAGYPF